MLNRMYGRRRLKDEDRKQWTKKNGRLYLRPRLSAGVGPRSK
jgi:hypothetical protein